MDIKKQLRPLMLGGTGSDVGKSTLVAGLGLPKKCVMATLSRTHHDM